MSESVINLSVDSDLEYGIWNMCMLPELLQDSSYWRVMGWLCGLAYFLYWFSFCLLDAKLNFPISKLSLLVVVVTTFACYIFPVFEFSISRDLQLAYASETNLSFRHQSMLKGYDFLAHINGYFMVLFVPLFSLLAYLLKQGVDRVDNLIKEHTGFKQFIYINFWPTLVVAILCLLISLNVTYHINEQVYKYLIDYGAYVPKSAINDHLNYQSYFFMSSFIMSLLLFILLGKNNEK